MKLYKKILLGMVFFILYLISTVPVGLFLYSFKSSQGINAFEKTGYHAYINCLEQEARKTLD